MRPRSGLRSLGFRVFTNCDVIGQWDVPGFRDTYLQGYYRVMKNKHHYLGFRVLGHYANNGEVTWKRTWK